MVVEAAAKTSELRRWQFIPQATLQSPEAKQDGLTVSQLRSLEGLNATNCKLGRPLADARTIRQTGRICRAESG